ncbi:MAG: hypothetical protein WC693_03195 [Patescibacteria group bacterium]|jgi:hypothetical protein
MSSIGMLKSGEAVIDRHQSHLHPGVVALLPDALRRIDAVGRNFLIEEVDFGQLIGETVCVQTTDADKIVWAKRPGRFGLTRFVKNRTTELCSVVTIILKRDGREDFYILITAFVGHRPEPEPWDRNATEQSVAFWRSHALVWGYEAIVPGTETDECPR